MRASGLATGRVRPIFGVLLAGALATACDDSTPSDAGVTPAPDAAAVADAGPALDAANADADAVDAEAAPDAGPSDSGEVADSGATDAGGFVPPSYGRWVKFEPPGAVCANGSPYKFFVNFSRTSSNVVIYLEGGGACWDYASCTGTGVRTAANKDGIPDNHASAYTTFGGINLAVDTIFPLLNSDARVSPMADWNKVFIPYCTGDVFSGDQTVTYDDPEGSGAPVEFHHVGHRNILRTIESLSTMFPMIPRMFVGGCSAGGAGAIINYYSFRTGLNVDKGYLLDDSGPIFPDQEPSSRSLPLHNRVRASWNVDPLINAAPQSEAMSRDFGALGRILAETFPSDRMAHTHFRLDYNYSLYSYERFYAVDAMSGAVGPFGDGSGLGGLGLDENVSTDRAAVYSLWWDDSALLRSQFDSKSNLAYYMPFYRNTNSSHCLTIPGFEEFPEDQLLNIFIGDFPRLAWAGTELTTTSSATLNLRTFVDELLDDGVPLQSYFEEDGEGRYLACTPDPRYFDAAACAAAH